MSLCQECPITFRPFFLNLLLPSSLIRQTFSHSPHFRFDQLLTWVDGKAVRKTLSSLTYHLGSFLPPKQRQNKTASKKKKTRTHQHLYPSPGKITILNSYTHIIYAIISKDKENSDQQCRDLDMGDGIRMPLSCKLSCYTNKPMKCQ